MNKLFGLFLLAFAFLAPDVAQAANCFWVGGTGSINDVTHWSSSSGGSGSTCGAAGGWPNSTSDNATFDASSGGGTITRNVNWTLSGLGIAAFTGTFGNSTDTATVNLLSWTNNGSGTHTVNMGTGTWTCGIAATTACTWSQTGATNLTFNANTSTLVFSGSTSSGGQIANLGSQTYSTITFGADTMSNRGTNANAGSPTISTLNIGAGNYLAISNGATWIVTTLNFTGGSPSITALTTFLSQAVNNAFTIALANPATCSYCSFKDTTVTTSTITATNSFDNGHNTNVSITPPPPVGGGGRIIGG